MAGAVVMHKRHVMKVLVEDRVQMEHLKRALRQTQPPVLMLIQMRVAQEPQVAVEEQALQLHHLRVELA